LPRESGWGRFHVTVLRQLNTPVTGWWRRHSTPHSIYNLRHQAANQRSREPSEPFSVPWHSAAKPAEGNNMPMSLGGHDVYPRCKPHPRRSHVRIWRTPFTFHCGDTAVQYIYISGCCLGWVSRIIFSARHTVSVIDPRAMAQLGEACKLLIRDTPFPFSREKTAVQYISRERGVP
jgi:hypothetical protein